MDSDDEFEYAQYADQVCPVVACSVTGLLCH